MNLNRLRCNVFHWSLNRLRICKYKTETERIINVQSQLRTYIPTNKAPFHVHLSKKQTRKCSILISERLLTDIGLYAYQRFILETLVQVIRYILFSVFSNSS